MRSIEEKEAEEKRNKLWDKLLTESVTVKEVERLENEETAALLESLKR